MIDRENEKERERKKTLPQLFWDRAIPTMTDHPKTLRALRARACVQVSTFSPDGRQQYLAITSDNVLQVFPLRAQ